MYIRAVEGTPGLYRDDCTGQIIKRQRLHPVGDLGQVRRSEAPVAAARNKSLVGGVELELRERASARRDAAARDLEPFRPRRDRNGAREDGSSD